MSDAWGKPHPMAITAERLDEIEAGCQSCRQCGSAATMLARFPSGGSEFFCDPCIQQNEATSDEVDMHELRTFGGAYGLCPRPTYEPLCRADPATISELVRLARIGGTVEVSRKRVEIHRDRRAAPDEMRQLGQEADND
jgi:hypothetical protein